MDLSIIIVTFNSRVPVERCLASLAAHPPRRTHETIVVDNASADGTAEMIAERFAGVRLLTNAENLGYSRGVNQGMRASAGKALLILNPDIVVREGSIDRLLEFMDRTPDAGIVGAKLVYPDGSLQHSCRSFYTVRALVLRRTFLGALFPRARALREHLLLDYDHETARKVDWVLGACMLVRREALEKVGAMDERFFLYFEDIDWCYRMKNQGWAVYYEPASVMVHTYERSSAKSVFRKPFIFHMLSLLRYAEKWNGLFYFVRRNRGAFKAAALVIADLAAFNLSFFAAYLLRDLIQPLFINSLYPVSWYQSLIIFYNLVFFLTFLAGGLYRVRRETPPAEEALRVARAVILGLVIIMAATYLSRVKIYSRAVVLEQGVFILFIASLFRRILRQMHRELVRARFDLRRVLLVGTKGEAAEIAGRLEGAQELGIEVVGFAGDDGAALGRIEELSEIAERFKIQEVIICESHQRVDALLPFLAHSRRRMIQIKVLSPLARYLGTGVRVEELAGMNVFSMERGVGRRFQRACKRCADFLVGLIVLPVATIASLGYRLYGTMSGRVEWFTERRIGRGGRMIAWPRVVGSAGREAGDLVKPGLFLSLVSGRLSLVGPPALADGYPASCFGALARMRPGITGAWRVGREETTRRALEEEALGLESWSIEEDLMVIASSAGAIFSGKYPAWFYSKGESV